MNPNLISLNFPNIRQLSYEEVVQYLVEKKVDPRCPCCGSEKQMIQAGPGENVTIGYFVTNNVRIDESTGQKKLAQINQSGVLSIGTECMNCGYLRHFSLATILQHFIDKGRA